MFFPKNFFGFKLKNIEQILTEKKSYLCFKKSCFTKIDDFQFCDILSERKNFSKYKMKKNLFFKAYQCLNAEKKNWLVDLYFKRTFPETSKGILKIENPTYHYFPKSYQNLSTQIYSKEIFFLNLSQISNKASKKKIRWSTLGKIMKIGPKNIKNFLINIKKAYLFENSLNFQRQFVNLTGNFLKPMTRFIHKKYFIIRKKKILKKFKKFLNISRCNIESSN
jgi:hypothetical protein